jgi:probable F420-dependent oxidoreductase
MKFWLSALWKQADQLVEIARTAEDVGFYGIATSDHMVYFERPLVSRYPYSADGKPWWNPATHWPDTWVSIGAMAAVTSRLRFTNSVYILPMRNVFTVAKAIGTAAVISNNRVTLGVGIGWQKEEFDLVGEDFQHRGKRCDEMIEVLRLLWKGGTVEYHGKFYDLEPLAMSPAPTQPVPVYISGYSEAALRRAARLGDGLNLAPLAPDAPYSLEDLPRLIQRVRDLRREAGRDGLPFEIKASAEVVPDVDHYKRLEDMGVTSTSVFSGDPSTPTSLSDQRQFMEEFAEAVLARIATF